VRKRAGCLGEERSPESFLQGRIPVPPQSARHAWVRVPFGVSESQNSVVPAHELKYDTQNALQSAGESRRR